VTTNFKFWRSTAAVIVSVVPVATLAATGCELQTQMQTQRENAIKAAGETIKAAVIVPEQATQAASCIGNIMNPTLTVDAAFTKALTDALMKEACRVATDTINDSISSVLGSAGVSTDSGLFGAGIGIRSGSGGVQVNTRDTSGQAASQIGGMARQSTAPITGAVDSAAGDVWGSIK
jgi:hypothetical protein